MCHPRPPLRVARVCTLVVAALFPLASPARAQIGWAAFHLENQRLSASSGLGLSDVAEKDYAWGDLDRNGWVDLVVVRKQPHTTPGRRVNVLFMNEGGTLVDRSAQFASDTDVAGDQGFLTPTNDRDVVVVDVDLDGWLDVVTSPTLSPGQPKHISHPRVYMNKGLDGNGNWLGLRFENARFPDLGTFPNFCAVAAGDVTGDGFPDLYYAHYEQLAQVDLDDRLLVNDGTGHFVDESSLRMSSGMLASSFGTAAIIADMNGDGVADVVKDTALGQTGGTGPRVVVDYNDPSNEGFFNILDQAYSGAPYHVNVGDLNKDGRLDLVISDDQADRYMLNQGNDGLGRVKWSPPHTYQITGGSDDGFGSNNIVTDLNGDGWGDVLICDVDVDIPSCGRRLHVYHNQGGTVGGNVTLREEAGAGWRGVTGMASTQMTGAHDVAIFDLDNDGDLDLVLGRCSGTSVWINELYGPLGTSYCGPAVANSSGAPATVRATGSAAAGDNALFVWAGQLPGGQFGYFVGSQTQGFTQNPGGSQGNLCLGGAIGRYTKQIANSGPGGTFGITIDLTNMPPPLQTVVNPGESWNFQAWFRDKNPMPTSNFTDGVEITFQ